MNDDELVESLMLVYKMQGSGSSELNVEKLGWLFQGILEAYIDMKVRVERLEEQVSDLRGEVSGNDKEWE